MSTFDPKQLDLNFNEESVMSSSSDDCYTISIDPSIYSSSITSPCVVTWNSTPCYTTSYNFSAIGTTYSTGATVKINTDGIEMEEGTDIKIGKQKLSDVLSKLEERLNILHYNPDLEDKWQDLRDLGEKYRALEKELIEKEKMWKILKDS